MNRRLDEQIFMLSGGGVIAVTGAGGKTSLLVLLSRYCRDKRLRVLQTTTTKVQNPRWYDFGCDHVFFDDEVFHHEPKAGEIVFYGMTGSDDGKIHAPDQDAIGRLSASYDVTIVEADGARRLPLKLHTARDPVIPTFVTSVIAVMGLSSLGKRRADVCFGERREGVVDVAYLQSLLNDDEGACKGFSPSRRCMVFCNQYETLSAAEKTDVKRLSCEYPLLWGSVLENRLYDKRV